MGGDKTVTVTLEYLRDIDACGPACDWFVATYGADAEVPLATVLRAVAETPHGTQWVAWYVAEEHLPARAWEAYDAATGPAREAYDAAMRSAQGAYDAATLTAEEAYDAAVGPAWEAYRAAVGPAREAYRAAVRSAQGAYDAAVGPAQGAYDAAVGPAEEVYRAAMRQAIWAAANALEGGV